MVWNRLKLFAASTHEMNDELHIGNNSTRMRCSCLPVDWQGLSFENIFFKIQLKFLMVWFRALWLTLLVCHQA